MLSPYWERLRSRPLFIADIGSTGGVSDRWHPLRECCRFYTFDPDPRDAAKESSHALHFRVGLWSEKGEKALHLTQFPSASTFFPFDPALSAFQNAACHTVVGQISVPVDTLEQVLHSSPSPQFLKVDTEGADLEILKGSERFLKSSCWGVEVEVSFVPRHEGAPLYGEVSAYLEGFGFRLFDLKTERWIRKNGASGAGTRAQLVWGDALFFLSREAFFQRIADFSLEEKKTALLHFALLLLAHQLHDYAVEIVQAGGAAGVLPEKEAEELEKKMRKGAKRFWRLLGAHVLLLALGAAAFLCLAVRPRLRKRAGAFLAGRFKELLALFLGLAKTGPSRASIYF